jgi:hypothetical protein
MRYFILVSLLGLSVITAASDAQANAVIVDRTVTVTSSAGVPAIYRKTQVRPTAVTVVRTPPAGYRRVVINGRGYLLFNRLLSNRHLSNRLNSNILLSNELLANGSYYNRSNRSIIVVNPLRR